MSNYFITITETLNQIILDKSQVGIDKFENHISLNEIHGLFPEIIPRSFQFEQVSNNISEIS